MLKQNLIILTLLIATMVLIAGCSGGNNSIVSPNTDSSQEALLSGLPVGVSDWIADKTPASGVGALGVFNLRIEPSNLSAELISLRSNSLTDVLEIVDITNFLQMAPCYDCAKLDSISLDADGNLVVTIGIKHPFGTGDPLKPITGKNRADLHVFNIEGTVLSNAIGTTFPNLDAVSSGFTLINADGYSGYLDDVLDDIYPTDATIHPYILHFDDYTIGNYDSSNPMGFLSVTDPPPSGNLVMAMGCDYDYQDYVFDLGVDPIDFIYAVGCTYAVSSASKNERFAPEFRIPQHNKKAASEVSIVIISNDLAGGNTSSTAEIEIHVVDIGHGVAVGTGLNEMLADSSVGAIIIGLPGIELAAVNVDISSPTGTGHDSIDPLVFPATITNTASADEGTYVGLVKVVDSYSTGLNESPLLNGADGIQRVDPLINPLTGCFNIDEFATYATFEIEISSVPEDPVAIILTSPDPPDVSTAYPIVSFDGSTSYDPDGGPIVLYEWDFDWDLDPANFSPDISGTEAIVDFNYHCPETSYYAGLRVTDNDVPLGISSIAYVEINVDASISTGSWEGSTGFANETILGSFIYDTGQMLQVDSTGLVHIITVQSGVIQHRTFDGTTVSGSESLANTSSARMVTSNIDASDELHVFWINTELISTDPYFQYEYVIYRTVTVSGAFTGVNEELYRTAYPYTCEMMNTHSGNNGDFMITWLHRDDPRNESVESYIDTYYMFSIYNGTSFSTPDFIPQQVFMRAQTGHSPSYVNQGVVLTATPNGHYHQIYYSKKFDLGPTVVFDHVYNGTSWDAIREIHNTGSVPYDLNVCAGIDGDIHVTGAASGGYVRYIRYDSSIDTWLPIITVANNANGSAYGAIAVNAGGSVHLIYSCSNDNYLHMKVFCSLDDESTILGVPDTVVDSSTAADRHKPTDVIWDNDGNLLALYQGSLNSPIDVFFNRFLY